MSLIYTGNPIRAAFKDRRWLVIPTSITGSIDFTQVLQSDIESLKLSIDGSKTFIKYEIFDVKETYTEIFEEGSFTVEAGVYGRPSIFSEEYIEYTHEQMLELLSTSEWEQ